MGHPDNDDLRWRGSDCEKLLVAKKNDFIQSLEHKAIGIDLEVKESHLDYSESAQIIGLFGQPNRRFRIEKENGHVHLLVWSGGSALKKMPVRPRSK